jgi:tetratricopeptide (TPR) repeat protein
MRATALSLCSDRMRILLFLAPLLISTGALAAERAPVPDAAEARLAARDFAGAGAVILPVFEQCMAAPEPGDSCLDIVMFMIRIADAAGDAPNYDKLLAVALQYAELVLPPLDRELADLRSKAADRQFVAGDYAAAEALYRTVLAARRAATPVDDPALAEALSDLQLTLRLLKRYDDALPFAIERTAVARRIGDPEKLADALWREGQNLLNLTRYTDAEARLRESAALDARGRAGRRAARLATLDMLSLCLFEQRRLSEARTVAIEAFALAIEVEGERGDTTLDIMGDIAIYDRDLGDLDAAESGLRAAIGRADGTSNAAIKARVRLYSALATVLLRRGRALDAVQIMAKPIDEMAMLSSGEQNDLSDVLQNYAVSLAEIGRLADAEVMSRRVLAIRKATLRADDPLIARALSTLGYILDKRGRREDALAAHIEATTLRLGQGKDEATLARDDLLIVSVGNVAVTLVQLGRLEQAKPFQELALQLSKARFPAGSSDLATALNRWAQYRKAMGVCDGLDAAREARAIWAREAGVVSPNRVIGDINLALHLRQCRGDAAEQRTYWRDAVRYLLADVGQSTDYDARAKTVLSDRRVVFLGNVDANWQLAQAAKP